MSAPDEFRFVVGQTYTEEEILAATTREQRIGFPADEVEGPDWDDAYERGYGRAVDRADVDGYERNGAVDGFGIVHSDAEDGL